MFTAGVFNTALWVKLWLLEIAQQPTNLIRIDFGPLLSFVCAICISTWMVSGTRYLIAETSIYQKTSTVNKCPQDFSYWIKNISNRIQRPSHLQMTGTTPGRFRRNSDLIWRHIPNLLWKLCCEWRGKNTQRQQIHAIYLKHKNTAVE